MKLHTIVVDDEPIALEKLKNYVAKTPTLELTAACQSAFDALEIIAGNSNIDLIITDINMPELSGMELVKSLKAGGPMVIFTTAFDHYAVESYRVDAVDYLLKPFNFVDFQQAVGRAVARCQQSLQPASDDCATPAADESIFIKVDYRHIRVNLADITYIKGFGEYLQVFLAGNPTPLVTLSSFAAIRERLSPNFIQIHRSYVVNINRAIQVERNRVVVEGDSYLPVGDSYRAELQSYLAAHGVGKGGKTAG